MHLFCSNCQTYLGDVEACSVCGQPRLEPPAASPRWRVSLEVTTYGTPVAAKGLLFLLTGQGYPTQHTTALALDLSTQAIRWRCQLQGQLVNDPILSYGETLYVATRSADPLGQGLLLALDAAHGDERWRWATGAQAISAPALVDDGLYVTLDGDELWAVDAHTGHEGWHLRLPMPRSVAAPAISPAIPQRLFLPSRGPHLCAVDVARQAIAWHYRSSDDAGDWFLATPALADGRLFAASTGGALLALEAETGKRLWRAVPGRTGRALTAPVAGEGHVYVGGHDQGIYALNADSGETLWRRETARRVEGRPLLLDDVLYVTGHDHCLRALDAAAGLELWHVELSRRIEGGPASAGDLVLAADREGNVVAAKRVLTAEVYAAQEHWKEAAAVYARRGHLAAAAQVYEEHLSEPFHAAELWQVAGRPDRAAPLYRQAGAEDKAQEAHRQAADRAAAAGDHLQAGDSYAAVEAWAEAGEQYEQASRPDLAAPAFEKAGLTARAAERYGQAGHWAEAARLYERTERWATAEAFCREAFDEVQAEACRRQIARHQGLPYIEAEIVPPKGMITGRYATLRFTLHNVGGGEAHQIVVHSTPSEFVGELSQTMEIRGLPPGQRLQQFLSLRPLASGPVPLVVAIDYADQDGTPYQTAYRTRITVLEPDEPPAARPDSPAMTADFADFDLLIGPLSGEAYPVQVVNSPAGEGRGELRLPFERGELREALEKLEVDEADEGWSQDFGGRLFTSLFQGPVGNRFRSSQGMVAQGKGLRLRLRVEAADLLTLPWELLYDPERREFLSLTRRSPVVRHLRVPHPTVARPVVPPLQMLVVPASPKGLMPLDIQAEVTALRSAVEPLVEEGRLALDVLKPPAVQALREYLVDYPPHILHFIGHGGFDGQEGYLALEDAQRGMERLDARELKVLFSNTPVRLAVLNACLTARDTVQQSPGVPERAYLGVAPALVDAGLLAVVASQFSLSDVGARLFAQGFYRMLARGRPVDEAVDQARVAMMLELGLACRDWAAPVLFLRGSTGELFP